MSFSDSLAEFLEKLECLGEVVKQIHGIKVQDKLELNLRNCVFKGDHWQASPSSIKPFKFTEDDLNNLERFKTEFIAKIKKEKKDKEIYDLNWQISYITHETSPEHIAERLKTLEKLKEQVRKLDG
jgi:hypothetical protein